MNLETREGAFPIKYIGKEGLRLCSHTHGQVQIPVSWAQAMAEFLCRIGDNVLSDDCKG